MEYLDFIMTIQTRKLNFLLISQSIEMGKPGSLFTKQELGMEIIYKYMLNLLTEDAKLLNYKPVIPKDVKRF
jgi:Glycosyl transferase family 90